MAAYRSKKPAGLVCITPSSAASQQASVEPNANQQKLKFIVDHNLQLQNEIKGLREKILEYTQREKTLTRENKALKTKLKESTSESTSEKEHLKSANEKLKAKVLHLELENENVESHNEELMRRISDFKRALLQNNKSISQLNYYFKLSSDQQREIEHLRYELDMERRNKNQCHFPRENRASHTASEMLPEDTCISQMDTAPTNQMPGSNV